MSKRTKQRRETKINLPQPQETNSSVKLPFNGTIVQNTGISFSFSSFDRTNELFNLGGRAGDGTVGGKWFLRMLDCLKNVSGKTISELKQSSVHQLHPVDWTKTNVKPPAHSEQSEYWQFRIDKSHGRIIGILIDYVFYVVWLDPYHNLTDSEGYGGVKKFSEPKLK